MINNGKSILTEFIIKKNNKSKENSISKNKKNLIFKQLIKFLTLFSVITESFFS